jgi:hypothetical protein
LKCEWNAIRQRTLLLRVSKEGNENMNVEWFDER